MKFRRQLWQKIWIPTQNFSKKFKVRKFKKFKSSRFQKSSGGDIKSRGIPLNDDITPFNMLATDSDVAKVEMALDIVKVQHTDSCISRNVTRPGTAFVTDRTVSTVCLFAP